MDDADMPHLAQAQAEVKTRQDVNAALTLMHSDMRIEPLVLGTVAQGVDQNRGALVRFFAPFPDYSVELASRASNGHSLVAWGAVHVTLEDKRIGLRTNGTRLPAVMQFLFSDRLIPCERFFFDLSPLTAQSSVSGDVLRKSFFKGST